MKTLVTFRSDAFPPYEEENVLVNPGQHGKRLAEFLVQGLKSKGYEPIEPIAEDWGWVVPIRNDSFRLWIGCGNNGEPPDGFLCFIEPHTPTIRTLLVFGQMDVSTDVMALQQAIDQLLSETASIGDKQWWTFEEFNRRR